MLDTFIHWISLHATTSHWLVFALILLAGANIPITIDLVVIAAATIGTTLAPEHTLHLYMASFLGCYFSAWISYWLGRIYGPFLLKIRWIQKLFPPKRLEKIAQFYQKRSFLTLLIGRFIPFGVRNCLFFSSGITKTSFSKFALFDALTAFIWSSSLFWGAYLFGKSFDSCSSSLFWINLSLFTAFGVSLISILWYKKRKKISRETPVE